MMANVRKLCRPAAKTLLAAAMSMALPTWALSAQVSCDSIKRFVDGAPLGFKGLSGAQVKRLDVNPEAIVYRSLISPYVDQPVPSRCVIIEVPKYTRPSLDCELTEQPVDWVQGDKLLEGFLACLSLSRGSLKSGYWVPGYKVYYSYPNGVSVFYSYASVTGRPIVPLLKVSYFPELAKP
jgi:hypothetical protein